MDALFLLVLFGVSLWACWHWFLHNWIKSSGLLGFVKGKLAASQIPDEKYFEQASREIRDGNLREGLWAQAWAEANGDKEKAQASYIRIRVDVLKCEAARRFAEFASSDGSSGGVSLDTTVVPCSRCGAKLRMPSGRWLDVRCTKCGHEFRVDTANGNSVEEYPSAEAQVIGRIGRIKFLWLWLTVLFIGGAITIAIKEGGLGEPTITPLSTSTILLAAVLVFNFAILIARLRDSNKSGWWSLLALIPFVYVLVVFYLLVIPGTAGRNRFGRVNGGLFLAR